MNDVAHNIKMLRKRTGITQDELSERLHVTRQAVSNWENAKTQPDIDTLMSLSKIFSCDVDELLHGEKVKEPPYRKIQKKYLVVIGICTIIICASIPIKNYADACTKLYFTANYKVAYFAYMQLVWAAAAVLCLSAISLFSDISLKTKSARRTIIIVFDVAVILILLFWILFFADTQGLLGQAGEKLISVFDKPVMIYIPAAAAGAALFFAVNNKRKKVK